MCVVVCVCVCVHSGKKGEASQQNVEINTDTAQIVKNYLHDGLQMIAALELRPSESNTCTPPTSRGASHTGDGCAGPCSHSSSIASPYHRQMHTKKKIHLQRHSCLRGCRWPRGCRGKQKWSFY